MDGVRSDDFAGLLAALGRSNTAPPLPSAVPGNMTVPSTATMPSAMPTFNNPYPSNQPFWQGGYPDYNYQLQQQLLQQQLLQQQLLAAQQPLTAEPVIETSKSTWNPWIIGLLVVLILVCVIIAWARMTRVVSVEEQDEIEPTPNETFAKDSRREPREVPAPSSVTFADFEDEEEEDLSQYVAENLLQYVDKLKKAKNDDEIDISGLDIPLQLEVVQPTRDVSSSSKRIVADDSPEVIDYGKRRDALFKDTKQEEDSD